MINNNMLHNIWYTKRREIYIVIYCTVGLKEKYFFLFDESIILYNTYLKQYDQKCMTIYSPVHIIIIIIYYKIMSKQTPHFILYCN